MFGEGDVELNPSRLGDPPRATTALPLRVPRVLIHLAAIVAATAILVAFAWPPRYLGVQHISDCYQYPPTTDIQDFLHHLSQVVDPQTGFCNRPRLYQHGSAWLLGALLVIEIWLIAGGFRRAVRAAWQLDKLWPAVLWLRLGGLLLSISTLMAYSEVVV